MNPLSILLIDDNEKQANKLIDRLKVSDCVASVNLCGFNEDEIGRCVNEMKPDVILLDCYDMQSINKTRGIELAQSHGRGWRRHSVTAIIFLTVFASNGASEIGRSVGMAVDEGVADGHVQKPATSGEILQEIKRVLNAKEEK